MASNQQIIIAFEPYGTFLSMESFALKLADHIHERAETVVTVWRKSIGIHMAPEQLVAEALSAAI